MRTFVYIATSLDGYIATTDGGIDWLLDIPNPENSDYGFSEFMNGIDAVVMGRNSYQKVLTFGSWPYEKPVIVLSNTLKAITDELADKIEIIKGDIPALLKQITIRNFKNLYIDGGKVIQSFIENDLIDEMIITKIPILLGSGIPLFGRLDQHLKFTHQKTEVFNKSLVKSYYVRNR